MRRPLLAGLALALALTGCGPSPAAQPSPAADPSPAVTSAPEEERAALTLPCAMGELHPITGSGWVNSVWTPLVYRGLFALGPDFAPEGDLCAGYEVSEDGLTWTLALKAASFSDGSPLTAAEAAASLELARTSARCGGRLAGVTGARAEGDRLVLTLSRPNGALPALLDVPIVKETGGDWPLGTGDYRLLRGEEGLSLTAREGRGADPAVIPLIPVETPDDLIRAFDTSQITLVDTDLTGTGALGYSGRYETIDYPTSTLLYLGANAVSGPCREAEVRRAVSLALDRETLVGRLLAGHGQAASLPVHPFSGRVGPEEDVGQAAQLLEARGGAPALRLAVNQDSGAKVSLARAAADRLEELGCQVTLEVLPWADFLTALERRDFDLYLGETAMTADFDPAPLAGTGGGLNYGGYSLAELDGAMDLVRETGGEAEAVRALEELWSREAPVIPLCFKNGSVLVRWGQNLDLAPTQREVFYGGIGETPSP